LKGKLNKSHDTLQYEKHWLDYLKKSGDKLIIIRLHLFYPFVIPKLESEGDWKSGITTYKDVILNVNSPTGNKGNYKWKEIRVDIDANSMNASGLFPELVLKKFK